MPNGTNGTDTWSQRFNSYGALFVTIIIFGLYAAHPDNQTLQNLAILAAGFWLGSSNSSQNKDATIAAVVSAPTGTGNGGGTSPTPIAPPPPAPRPAVVTPPPAVVQPPPSPSVGGQNP